MSATNLDRRLDHADWRPAAALAGVLLAGGITGLLTAAASIGVSLAVCGAAFLAAGLGHFALSFAGESERGARWTGRALGTMMAVLGAALFFDPFAGLAPLRGSAGFVLTVVGVLRVAFGWRLLPDEGRVPVLGAGVLSILLGLVLMSVLPTGAPRALAALLAVDLAVAGTALLTVARQARSAAAGARETARRGLR
ncbi:MAG: DUF308 domain-containing protein [Rhodosalinus sp.]